MWKCQTLILALLIAHTAVGQAPSSEPPLPPGAVQRLGDTRFRPGCRIKDLAFSPDGSRLVSVGNWMYFEERLSVWDTATGREVFTQPAADGSLSDVGWGLDGGFAVRTDGSTRLWAFADKTGKHPDPTAGPASPAGPRVVVAPVGVRPMGAGPERMALSADGSRLAIIPSGGGSIQLFATKPGAAVADLKPIATGNLTPSVSYLGLHIIRGGKAVVVLSAFDKGQSVVVWDVEKNTVSDPVTVPAGVQQGTRQSADVAEDGSAIAVGHNDGTVVVFDLPSGKERLSVKKHDGPKFGGRWSEVSAVKFVNGGKQVLSAGRDNRQLVWDAKTGADIAALNGHHSWVEAVAISADGKRVATAGQDSLVRLWDATTWKPILPPTGPHETIWRLEGSRDGRYAAAESGSGVYVWDVRSGKEVRSLPMDPSPRRAGSVLFTPEGSLVTADGKSGLAVYPLPTGDLKPVPVKGRLLDFAGDGKTLITAEGTSIHVWDWPAGTRRREVPVKGEIQSATVSPDGRTAVVGLSGRSAAVIDLESGTVGDLGMKLHWFTHAAGFAAGGRAVCGTVGSAIAEAWSVDTRARVRGFEQPPGKSAGHFYQLSFSVSPDGRKAASCQSDGGVAVYEVATGKVLAHFAGHRDSVISVAWAGTDRVLSGGGDHQVLVWDVSVRALAGKVEPFSAADRTAAWDRLGTVPTKDAIKLMAAIAAAPDEAVTLIGEKLKPIPVADSATLDRIFRDLDAKSFAVRERAARELANLGPGAAAGARERMAKSNSEEVRGRAAAFLKTFAGDDVTTDRVRYLRSLEVLAAIDSPAARKLVDSLAGGAADVWETEAARQAAQAIPTGK